ncbi:MAG: ArsR family transcriptional regulator [Halobellus sp.]
MSQTATDSGSNGGGEFSLEAVLAVFHERSDRARPLTANDVMDSLGCSRRTAHNKLNALVERGSLATRKVGARGRVWWVPVPDGSAPGGIDARSQPDRDPEVEAEIASADIRGSGETLARRREALRAAYDYLSENPDATETEFLTEVFPEHPAGFKTADKWWAVIEPALKDLPNVDVAEDREHVWHYLGG